MVFITGALLCDDLPSPDTPTTSRTHNHPLDWDKGNKTLSTSVVRKSFGLSCMCSMEKKNIMYDRLQLLNAFMEARRLINKPLTKEEIPEDLFGIHVQP